MSALKSKAEAVGLIFEYADVPGFFRILSGNQYLIYTSDESRALSVVNAFSLGRQQGLTEAAKHFEKRYEEATAHIPKGQRTGSEPMSTLAGYCRNAASEIRSLSERKGS